MISLDQLNRLPAPEFTTALADIFEHSPWVPAGAAATRPFDSVIALHHALCAVVRAADVARQLALIRAHPELAGRAAIRGDLTLASTSEQQGAGLSACTPEQYARLYALNDAYRQRFGFPFVLAVKGHTPDTVIARLETRVAHALDDERDVALAEICRIARFRLADLVEEPLGAAIVSMAHDLAAFTETPGALTCSYLTATHRATAERIRDFMLAAGLKVRIDAVGNVIGRLTGDASTPALLTGSHYDTVVNAGRYDGRLGIVLPIVVAGRLNRAGVKLPFPLDVIAFAEEEGVRFKSTFLGSRALVGQFDGSLLDALDDSGVSLREAMRTAELPPERIGTARLDPATIRGFVEIHIEQGPVLLDAGLSVGVVTGMAGSSRRLITVEGTSGHSGTVPMAMRQDAATAAAEIILYVERRCRETPGVVGTVGRLEVPGGAVNVIPGRCELSLDVRSADDALRTQALSDILAEMQRIAERRGVRVDERPVLEAPSVPCAHRLCEAWARSVQRVTGAAARRLPSGAGHDAMMMANLTPVGMLFVRCGNGGISHHPDESLSGDDAATAARVFEDLLLHLEEAP